MSSSRIFLGLTALLLVTSTAIPARAQDHELEGAAIFEPSDERPYGNWAEPHNGLFVSFDGLFWAISAPRKTSIGDPTLTPVVYDAFENPSVEQNTTDNGFMRDKWKLGDRIEIGYVDDNQGFLITTLSTNSQTQFLKAQGVPVVFNDPAFGPFGNHYLDISFTNPAFVGRGAVTFDNLTAENKTWFEGVEALYLYRPHQLHDGGSIEFLMGARYFQLHDEFDVVGLGGNLANSNWDTTAQNQLIGPEVGVRWLKPLGRFAISAEGRFAATVNFENVNQNGTLADQLGPPPQANPLPTQMTRFGFNNMQNYTEFAPMVEFRVEGRMELTKLISAKVGWTGIWMDGIGRASDMVDYTLPRMGITSNLGGNSQSVFINGVNVGIELNR